MKSRLAIPILFGIVIILLLLNTCRINRNRDKQHEQITSLQLENQKLDSLTNKQGQTISTQQSIITDNTSILNDLTDSIFNLKKKNERNTETIAYYKAVTSTMAKNIPVPYKDTVAIEQFSDSLKAICNEVIDYMNSTMLKVPIQGEYKDSNLYFLATISKRNLVIDSMSVPDTLQLRFVERKGGLFKKGYTQVQFFHSNPLITTTQSNSVIYRPNKSSFFRRVVIPVAVGVGAGLLISK